MIADQIELNKADFQQIVCEGIPNTLPAVKELDPTVSHAPKQRA